MYSEQVRRAKPGCIVLLIDRSDSMKRPWAGSRLTLAHGAARAINNTVMELILRATMEEDEEPRRYFDIGLFGYGVRPIQGGEGVESAFGGRLAQRGIVPLPEVAANPLAIRKEPSPDVGGLPSEMPVWVEPVNGQRTPMCQAMAVAGSHIYDWAQKHPDSFPPIVINITDGLVTDEPYEGADLAGWARRLANIATRDGATLLFNIYLSHEQAPTSWFPVTSAGLPRPVGTNLWDISSELPPPMVQNARDEGIDVQPGARGMVMNADLAALTKFLAIGTTVEEAND
ncbi:MAG: VWA domain-containing protein [Pseudonocardia sp.]|nr:VWA domain-containing protein [Pseudonocardia sp.]